jgi:arabinofuranan 3-O-arabinosyltransferase
VSLTQPPDRVSATSALRLWCYGLLLCVFAFIQVPGKLVSDTKFDLVVDPGRFMARALSMWDAAGAFGQIQNQAYGYLFPMGPFFWLGEQLQLQMWVVQRLWWSLLLCVAFFGILRLARTLRLGLPWTQVVAAFAFALSCHLTTIAGGSSVEAWPTAVAPWILYCVVRGTEGGSERRWAAAAGLLTAACGGVNAVAVSVVLPLGACWIATRRGRRGWVFFGWWVGATVLATLWWLIPLLLMGAYSFPFLDYIENASVTTRPTGLMDVLAGTSDWVAYVDDQTFRAGHVLGTTPFLILDAAVLAALGLAGIARRDNPHARFLLLGVLLGVALVSFGYTGPGHGWAAETRQGWLDGALAPLRNLHKFDGVLRLPLALGTAHMLAVLARGRAGDARAMRYGSTSSSALRPALAVVALIGISSPWWLGVIAPAGPIDSVPDYWQSTADYLNETSDGSRVLVVPASPFGTYIWGSPRDDVLQPLMTTPWAVRNVVPLAQPGNVVLLDAVTRTIESGRPSARLADVLADNGIGRVVVRNDLDRLASGAPDPVVVHEVLDHSPGLTRAETFGPMLGAPTRVSLEDGAQIAPSGGLSAPYPAVEVYDVEPVAAARAARVQTVDEADVLVTTGAPGDALVGEAAVRPGVLAGDAMQDPGLDVVLSDGLDRREKNFAAVRANESATMTAGQAWRLPRTTHQHLMVGDQERWESTVAWDGIETVTASSSQAWADAPAPIEQGAAPGAALDGSTATAWRSARGLPATGQWWQVDLGPGEEVAELSFQPPAIAGVTRVRISDGDSHVDVNVSETGGPQIVPLGFADADHVRVTALETAPGREFEPFSLAEVSLSGVHQTRFVDLPAPPPGGVVDRVSLTRTPGTEGCFMLPEVQVCKDLLATNGDDGDRLNRRFELPNAGEFELNLTGSLRSGRHVYDALARELPFVLATTPGDSADVRASALALVDQDPRTTWISEPDVDVPAITLQWPQPHSVAKIRLALNPVAPAGRPLRVELEGDHGRREVDLDGSGSGTFEPLRTHKLVIRILDSSPVYDSRLAEDARLPAGVSDLSIRDRRSGEDLVAVGRVGLELPCGSGPRLKVNETEVSPRVETSVGRATLGDLDVIPCQERIALGSGQNTLRVAPSEAARVDHVDLVRVSHGPSVAGRPEESVPVLEWGDSNRRVRVSASDQRRLLVVSENFNKGWSATLDGKPLETQMVDGWRQGWWLPAGSEGEVQLTFRPQRWFVGGLLTGAAGVVASLVLLLVPSRRTPRPATGARSAQLLAWTVTLLVSGLLAGWVGFALGAAGLVVHLAWSRPRDNWGGAAGALVLLAGAANASERGRVHTLTAHAWIQWTLVGALVLAALASVPRGPLPFKASNGRSSA